MIEIIDAGDSAHPLDYRDGWALQHRLHDEVVALSRRSTLVLCEHAAVYTAGKRTQAHERPQDGSPVVDVDRGGRLTWHGPGQLVGYPIVRLREPVDVVAYVRALEGVLIDVLADFDVKGERVEGRSGVWIRRPDRTDKIAAIGIRVSQGATMHGFALNVSNSLEPYSCIVPCGISDAGVTTMSRERGEAPTMAAVRARVVTRLMTAAPSFVAADATSASTPTPTEERAA
ncbi:lipoyl(octanoyl) transferase LipB [Rathayibacter toxicus]|uniref:Octanoyltransferase n=1 Tax=Rathayibacter toxicus TaxID=145458 RepID=A0A2S5Y6Z3_9MICO|nr:lipoyl(octanoyl) transferase LipB [Rathayibacter toxicus]PPH23693.1 lipoate-protein ligase B [Rathayibacter toxicus]PPH57499.1 lipoate-protein ligase B [Rathayibacter toxicus]PPH59998.1 lipoate-protein ligase B [Rathayibacter toxicus]PPH87454.1 lipoate-protein ligase B [Rathayibacter toxicus]PPI15221.1 lipoate-protein ligase B [Rathayibacter toxicus]